MTSVSSNFILTPQDLDTIANNLVFTHHAKARTLERFKTNNVSIVKESIKKPFLAWKNTDGTINIALNDNEYFVIKQDLDKFVVITFKEKSKNEITTSKKFYLAFSGYKYKNK